MSKITQIDMQLANAFVNGVNFVYKNKITVYCYSAARLIYIGSIPIIWWDRPGGYLRFSLNNANNQTVRNRINGVMQILFDTNVLPHVYKFVVRSGVTYLREDNDLFMQLIEDREIMTLLPVRDLGSSNNTAELMRNTPKELNKIVIKDGAIVSQSKPKSESISEAAFLMFDDLAGVC